MVLSGGAYGASLVAEGNGFQISEAYIQVIEDYNTLQAVRTERSELVQKAVRTRLFAQEAQSLNLKPKEMKVNPEVVNEESVRDVSMFEKLVNDLAWAEAYAQHLKKNHEIPENVIESYYRVNWKKFDEDLCTQGLLESLDEKRREEVKQRVLKLVQNDIYEQSYHKLFDKYEVVVHE